MTVKRSRVVFVLYALALTTATHWPALSVGTETFPAPDKPMHMIAFGGLLVGLWWTRWVPRLWQAGLIVLVWTALDELSQSIEVLQRTFSPQDMVAGQLGVVTALAWVWALGPAGGSDNRVALGAAGVIVAAGILYMVVPGRQDLAVGMHEAVVLTLSALAIAVAVRVWRSGHG